MEIDDSLVSNDRLEQERLRGRSVWTHRTMIIIHPVVPSRRSNLSRSRQQHNSTGEVTTPAVGGNYTGQESVHSDAVLSSLGIRERSSPEDSGAMARP